MRSLATLLACALCLSACGDGVTERRTKTPDGGPRAQGCRSSCERNLWPRLVVGITGGIKARTATATNESGEAINGLSGGCPQEFSNPCSFSWITGPSTMRLQLRIELSDGSTYETSVDLQTHNYCGRNIAYVELALENQSRGFQEPEYISPCAGLVDEGDPRGD